MSIVERLTEGIVNRDLAKEGTALIGKWEQTGLLEGISDDTKRNGMARLLENQAKELLRESSSMRPHLLPRLHVRWRVPREQCCPTFV